ncbi:MAG TPA: MFS transporter [Bryobacteraceae bacterium]|nr:MFS transporter [Bryobacteraceae bacterium]
MNAVSNSAALKPPPAVLAWSVWGIAAVFYLTGFYQRVSLAVMTGELMRDFSIGAQDLGTLSAFYFYVYVAMQIPTGVLVDSHGARRLLIWGSISAALGTFVFGATHSFVVACAGRALVGGATAVGWLVLLKLATHWFPSQRFGMLTGLGLFFGNIGALGAQVPLRIAIEHYGWRAVVLASAAAILLVGALAWAIVKDDPASEGMRSFAPASVQESRQSSMLDLFKGFKSIFGYRNIWLIVFAQGGIVGPILAFTGLWGTPFLKARFAISSTTAAAVCSIMIVCWAISSPISGHLSDRIGKRKPIYLAGTVIAAAGWIVMFYVRSLPLSLFTVVAAITSLACGPVVIGFAAGKESVPARFLGTVTGAVNIGNMSGPAILQPAIGWILDRHWSGRVANGMRLYDSASFETGFLLIVAWSVTACILIAWTRETDCRQAVP